MGLGKRVALAAEQVEMISECLRHAPFDLVAAPTQREHTVDVGRVRWLMHVPGTDDYALIGYGTTWDLRTDAHPEAIPDVTITATHSALARFLTARGPRDRHAEGIEIAGKAPAIRTFLKAIEAFPPSPNS